MTAKNMQLMHIQSERERAIHIILKVDGVGQGTKALAGDAIAVHQKLLIVPPNVARLGLLLEELVQGVRILSIDIDLVLQTLRLPQISLLFPLQGVGSHLCRSHPVQLASILMYSISMGYAGYDPRTMTGNSKPNFL